MGWWKQSLYDTCSLITLDKLLQIRPTFARHFPKSVLALAQSFTVDQVRPETATRLRTKVTIQELPSIVDLTAILTSSRLSPALAEVDKLVFATASHFRLSVVTADRRLGRTLRDAGIQVTDVASVLRELVHTKKLSEKNWESLLQGLADQLDLILGIPNPTWQDLQLHSFPDRAEMSRRKRS